MNRSRSLLLVLSLTVMAPAGASELTKESAAECKLAERILLTMMSESESVRSEPAAHELLGDVYTAEGFAVQANCEYEIARVLAKRKTIEGEAATDAADALKQLFARSAEKSR